MANIAVVVCFNTFEQLNSALEKIPKWFCHFVQKEAQTIEAARKRAPNKNLNS
jgi:hypothetical protein